MNFLQYGPQFPTRAAAVDALEDYYATGEFSCEERTRIEGRRGRWVILVADEDACELSFLAMSDDDEPVISVRAANYPELARHILARL